MDRGDNKVSSVERDMIEGYSSIGSELNEFLYEGKVKHGKKKEHSKEELENMLEQIRKECWENYRSGSNHMGW